MYPNNHCDSKTAYVGSEISLLNPDILFIGDTTTPESACGLDGLSRCAAELIDLVKISTREKETSDDVRWRI